MATINVFPGLTYTSTTTYQVSDVANVYYLNPSTGVNFGAVINGIITGAGKKIVLAPGTYNIATEIAVTYNGITIEGSGPGATILNIDDSSGNIGDCISFTNCSGGRVSGLTITATTNRTAGNGIHITGGNPSLALGAYALKDADMLIEDVNMINQFVGILVDNDTGNDYRNWRTYIKGGRHYNISDNGMAIWINCGPGSAAFGASQFIEDIWVGDSTEAPLTGIRLSGTGDCTLLNNEVFLTDATSTLLMDPISGGFLTSVKVIGGFYDRCATACLSIVPHASVSKFGDINFTNVWFAGSTGGNCVDVVGATAKGVFFTACTMYSAEGSPGWCAKIDAATHVSFNSCNFASATTGGILFTNSASYFSVIGGIMSGAGVGTSGLTTLPTGVQIDAGSDHFIVSGVNMADAGVGGTAKITNTAGESAGRRLTANLNIVA